MEVRQFMVSVNKFAKISDTATFSGAIMALECAREEYLSGKREQKTVLITDNEGRVTGKLTPGDLMRSLMAIRLNESGGAFSGVYLVEALTAEDMTDKAVHWSYPLEAICETIKDRYIKDVIPQIDASEVIGPNESMNTALHTFAHFKHDVLLVMEESLIIGILRSEDVFKLIAKITKSKCKI